MISLVFEPRLKNRKVLTSLIHVVFDNDILPQLNNDYTEWTWYIYCDFFGILYVMHWRLKSQLHEHN